jgi:prephenate dehydratase
LEGHVHQPTVKKMLEELEGRVRFLKILGSYPRAATRDAA